MVYGSRNGHNIREPDCDGGTSTPDGMCLALTSWMPMSQPRSCGGQLTLPLPMPSTNPLVQAMSGTHGTPTL
eukprot:3405257-Amphidinium_carterae.1